MAVTVVDRTKTREVRKCPSAAPGEHCYLVYRRNRDGVELNPIAQHDTIAAARFDIGKDIVGRPSK
jgi:hypothetical protein